MPPFHPDTSLPNLSGKTYIVTGATAGIGLHTAARLAQHNAHVYICARTPSKGTTAISTIRALYPTSSLHLSILTMDHTSLSTVAAAARHFLTQETRLHGLVNNAGIMTTPFAITADGWEEQWQVNYLAHWVFTSLLLPIMLETAKREGTAGGVRIVNVSSSGHYNAPKEGIRFEGLALEGEGGMARYGQSKLANILHAKTLHRLYGPSTSSTSPNTSNSTSSPIWTSIVHPGLVKSSLGTNAEIPLVMRAAVVVARCCGLEMDTDMGAWTSLHCVAGKDMTSEESGCYFQRVADREGWQSGWARDEGLRVRLEEWTGKVMGRWVE